VAENSDIRVEFGSDPSGQIPLVTRPPKMHYPPGLGFLYLNNLMIPSAAELAAALAIAPQGPSASPRCSTFSRHTPTCFTATTAA
jgi:hypothetical protein